VGFVVGAQAGKSSATWQPKVQTAAEGSNSLGAEIVGSDGMADQLHEQPLTFDEAWGELLPLVDHGSRTGHGNRKVQNGS
jgi:hypothetical protein